MRSVPKDIYTKPPIFNTSPIVSSKDQLWQVKEMEERIQNLKGELKRKKEEARKLLKDQQQKKKEALRQQEVKLRKQIQVCFTM